MPPKTGSKFRKRWERIKATFQRAYPLAINERAGFLYRECHGDPELRARVESLLASDDSTGCLDHPLVIGGAVWPLDELDKRMVGEQIGPFRIRRGLASGGMGEVFLATRVSGDFDQTVAIKLLKRGMDNEEFLARFRAERRTLAALEHPNIARLIDGGSTPDGRPYFAMEYVRGTPVDRYCCDQTLTRLDRLNLFLTICSAVHYAHQNLVVHRDLKPGNILVTDDGAPKLLDFGIATLLTPALDGDGQDRVPDRTRLLTPYYASPEQISGTRITTASDVYSLGLVLHKILTGRLPLQGDGLIRGDAGLRIRDVEDACPSETAGTDGACTTGRIEPESNGREESSHNSLRECHEPNKRRLGGDLGAIILMALRKDPSRRYASVEQFAMDIRRHLAARPVEARKHTIKYVIGRYFKRNKVVVASAAAIAIVISAGLANTVRQSRMVRTERDHAVRARRQSETLTAFLHETLFSASPQRHGADTTVFELLEDAAGRIDTELAGDAESKANVHYAIGATYLALGKHDPANRHLRAALDAFRSIYLNDHERTASCLTELGVLLAHQKNPESVGLLKNALAMRTNLYGNEHPLVANVKCQLAYAYWHAAVPKQMDMSELLMAETLRTYQTHHPAGHIRFAYWTHSMGGVRMGQNRTQDAIELYEDARHLYLDAGADSNPHYIALLRHMAWAYQSLNRYADARNALSEYLDRRRVVYGAEWVSDDDQWELATLDTVYGDPADALRGYRSWLTLRCKTLARDPVQKGDTAAAIQTFLNADLNHSRVESAVHYRTVVTTLWEHGLLKGMEAPLTLFRLGRAYCELGNHVGSESLLQGCIEIRESLDDYMPCPDAQGWLGVAETASGKYESAAIHLAASYQDYLDLYGPEHELVYRAVDRMIEAYRLSGRPDQADAIWEVHCRPNAGFVSSR